MKTRQSTPQPDVVRMRTFKLTGKLNHDSLLKLHHIARAMNGIRHSCFSRKRQPKQILTIFQKLPNYNLMSSSPLQWLCKDTNISLPTPPPPSNSTASPLATPPMIMLRPRQLSQPQGRANNKRLQGYVLTVIIAMIPHLQPLAFASTLHLQLQPTKRLHSAPLPYCASLLRLPLRRMSMFLSTPLVYCQN